MDTKSNMGISLIPQCWSVGGGQFSWFLKGMLGSNNSTEFKTVKFKQTKFDQILNVLYSIESHVKQHFS